MARTATGPSWCWRKRARCPRLQEQCDWVLEIVRRPAEADGFQVLPKRWIVERTLAWLGRYRRPSKDDEATTASSEAWITIAMIHLMVCRRLVYHLPETSASLRSLRSLR